MLGLLGKKIGRNLARLVFERLDEIFFLSISRPTETFWINIFTNKSYFYMYLYMCSALYEVCVKIYYAMFFGKTLAQESKPDLARKRGYSHEKKNTSMRMSP